MSGLNSGQDARIRPFSRLAAELFPKLFGDEGHEGMQELEDFLQHPAGGGARLGLGRRIVAVQDRLGEFQIPVAEGVPGELVQARPPRR